MNEIPKFIRSFRFAYEGIKYALHSQQNMKFHFFIAFFVIITALFVQLSKMEILMLLLAIILVIVTELINTAIEKTVDLAMPNVHPLAKIAKDTAAASVLVAAFFAVVVGMVVFYDPIDRWFGSIRSEVYPHPSSIFILLLLLVVLVAVMIQTRMSDKPERYRPSVLAALSFSGSMLVSLLAEQTIIILLGYSLSLLLLIVLYEKKSRSLASLTGGAFVGAAVTWLAYYMIHFRMEWI